MSTSSYLANFGVTIEQAREYVFANLDNPQAIFATARQFGVTNEMLGEIAGGYSAQQVQGYLAGFGIDASALETEPLFPSEMLQFSTVMGLNTETGALSTASLREQVKAHTGAAAYAAAFDPNQYAGGLDGVFSAADLGVLNLGDLPATAETLESLFYGTIIRLTGTVDTEELQQVASFVQDNAAGLENEDPAVESALVTLMLGIVQDQAVVSPFTPALISEVAVASAVALVGFASQHDQSLFDELLTGFAF